MSRVLVALTGVVFLVSSPVAYPDDAETIPEPILSSWEGHWNQSVDEFVTGLVDRYRSKMDHVDELKRGNLLADMDRLFREPVTWETLGEKTVTRLLLNACGSPLIAEVAPYYSGDAEFTEMPEDLQRRFLSCYADVQLYVETTPVYAIQEVAGRELRGLFIKNGVDPAGF